MLKKIGIVTAGVTASLLAVVPFAMATEDHPAPTTSCDNGNGAHTGSDSQVKQTNAFNFDCAEIVSNNGELNQGSNDPDSSQTSDSSVDNSSGLQLPGFGG